MALTALKVYNVVSGYNVTATFYDTSADDVYEPETGTRTKTETSHTVYISPLQDQEKYLDGTLVRTGLVVTYFSSYGLTFTPEQNMQILVGSERYTIEELKTYRASSNTAIAYQAGLRK